MRSMMTDLMRSGTGQPQFLAGKWRQKNPRTYLCQAHAGIYDYSAFSFLVLALIPDCSALRAPTILSLMSLYASIFRFPIIYVCNVTGTPIDITMIVMTIFVVTIGSLGIAGIPGTATMAASVGLSGVGMGAQFGMVSPILAIDPIIDMARTMINVTKNKMDTKPHIRSAMQKISSSIRIFPLPQYCAPRIARPPVAAERTIFWIN